MKFLQVGGAHKRNQEFIERACKKFNIEYHFINYLNFPDNNYDIIWCPGVWINPDLYPSSKFIYGPHFWVFPESNHPFFTESKPEHANRCVYTTLSNWNFSVYNEITDLSKSNIPFIPLPFGLDIQPYIKNEIEYDCIIYFKNRDPSLLEFAKSELDKKSIKYKIYLCGSYELNDYINTLKKTKYVIWIGSHESQGFAFEECLATGTPIFVYDVKSMKNEYLHGNFLYTNYNQELLATTASYWDSRCGMKVYSNEEFINTLPEFINSVDSFRPSDFIKETLTDEVCFQRFLDVFKIKL